MSKEKTTITTTTEPMAMYLDGAYSVSKFDGEDDTYSSTKWAEDIEDNADIFNWTPQQKLIIARRSLSGTAALWLRTEKVFKTFEELKTALQKEFPELINTKEMHELMSARKKEPNETYYQYMLIMKEMGKRARFPDYISTQYIIEGIRDTEVNKTILYGATTYPVLKEKLKLYEQMKEKTAVSGAREVSERPVRRQLVASQAYSSPRGPVRRCFNCGEMNHQSRECPHKNRGVKCFKCNGFGHISSACSYMHSPSSHQQNHNQSNFRRQESHFQVGSNGGGAERTERPLEATQDMRKRAMFTTEADMTVAKVNKRAVISQAVKPTKRIKINKECFEALIDTGAEVNLLTESVYKKIGSPEITCESLLLCGLGLVNIQSRGKVLINVCIDGQFYSVIFHIMPNESMPYDVIIGQEFLKDVTLVMNEGSVVFCSKGEEWLSKIICCSSVVDLIGCHKYKQELLDIIEQYNPKQIKDIPLKLKIVLKDDHPVSQRPRRLSLAEQHIVEEQVTEWLQDGIIRVSFSDYASPVVLVKRKDGRTRLCIDYRLINRKIIRDEYPLPLIEDLIDKLQPAKVYSVIDLKDGFFHLKVEPSSIKFTAFVTHHGQYEFLRAPFGLSICPKYFMRFVSMIFMKLIAENKLVIFIDDLLIPALDEQEGIGRLKEVLTVAEEYGLQINWKKAKLLSRQVEYLGHVIGNGEVRPSPDKTDAVMKYPEPRTLKQLHSFVGLTSYFRKYIENFAQIARPLTELLKKDVEFEFGQEQRFAFNMLKEKLSSPPVLRIFKLGLPIELHTDASSIAYSAILLQRYNDGLHPVHYMSKKTNDAEKKYSSYELEALAIVEGVKKFRHYLYGSRFKIVTDCQAFELTLKKKDLTTRVARWVLLLDEYDYSIEHRPGSKMKHTDALSRIACVTATETNVSEKIKQAQQQDDGLNAIIKILKERPYKDYMLDNGLLYKGDHKCLVIPRSMEHDIIKKVHERGHFGKKKMLELLNKDYFMKNINKKIEDFIVGCIPCLLATKKEGKQEGFLNNIEKGSLPLDTLHCDHIGPFLETKKKYNYILTVIDGFTKFVWLFPTKSTTSTEAINKLLILQQTFGNARRYVTDRGTSFTSHDFKEYCDSEGIQHVLTTTGVPRANGQVERVHRILISVLTKMSISEPGLWYKHVGRVQMALNSTFQRSINTSPFELLIGTKMRCKEDIEIYDLILQEERECFSQEREDLRQQAKQQIFKIQEENQHHYNKKRKESLKYKEGDTVAIKRTQFGTSMKLKPKYLGPYRVTKVKRNDRYNVEKLDLSKEGPVNTSSSADYMKLWPMFMMEEGLGE